MSDRQIIAALVTAIVVIVALTAMTVAHSYRQKAAPATTPAPPPHTQWTAIIVDNGIVVSRDQGSGRGPGYPITLHSIAGHYYLAYYQGGLLHSQSCTNTACTPASPANPL